MLFNPVVHDCDDCPVEPPPECNVTFHVDGCDLAVLPGATVTVKSGATTIATGTTGEDGDVILDVGAAGSYTVEWSAPGYTTETTTESLACDGEVSHLLDTPDDDHFCCGASILPKTIYWTDGGGTHTLTDPVFTNPGGGLSPYYTWTLSVSYNESVSRSSPSCSCTGGGPGTMTVLYQAVFTCQTGQWSLSTGWYANEEGLSPPYTHCYCATGCFVQFQQLGAGFDAIAPLSYSGTMVVAGSPLMLPPPAGIGYDIVISE